MILRCLFALDPQSGAEPPLYEDQKAQLLRSSFKGPSLFGEELSSVYKVSVERAMSITVYSVDLSILIGDRDIVLIPTALFRSHVELRS